MTERVLLHVGSPKSGTTYLQQVLRANSGLLADHGVLVAGETHRDLVHAGMVVRQDPRLERLPERARAAWDRLVAQIRGFDGTLAVVSYELFSVATADQARRALEDLSGLEVDVVVTAKDLGRALSSAWQERLKFALTTPLEEWEPPAEGRVRSEWGWRSLDPAGVLERWSAGLPDGHAHLVTTPRAGDAELLWERFAEVAGLESVPVVLPETRANESLGPVAAEVLRRVNEQLGDRLTTGAEQARWLRDLLANGVLTRLDDEQLGIPEPLLAQAEARYDEMLARLGTLHVEVHGDLEDLRPTQRAGARPARLPGDATDRELLEVAVRALAGTIVRMRDDAARPRGPEPAPQQPDAAGARGVRGRLRGRLRELAGHDVHAEVVDLNRRIDELQQEITEARALQHELAALSDLVTELLLPDLQRDDAAMREALRAYRQLSLVPRQDTRGQ